MIARITFTAIAAALLGMQAALPSPATAQPRSAIPAAVLTAGGGVSLDQAAARIKRQTGGRILAATTVTKGGRRIHRIKVLLPSGEVRIYQVNASGG